MKQRGLEVPYLNGFLGSGHTQEVTTASASMEFVQDSVIFVNSQTSTKNGFDPTYI